MDYDFKIKRVSKNLILGTSRATQGAYYNSMQLQKSQDPDANKAAIVIALKNTSWFERLWYPIFFIAGILCLIFIRPFTFELCFAVLSLWLYMFANNLLARGNLWGLILSIISSSLYVIVSFFAKVYGEVIINVLLYIPLDVIAVITFKKNKNKSTDELNVRAMEKGTWLATAAASITAIAAIFVILFYIPGQQFPLLNTISIVLFVAALILRNMRFKEFWWFDLIGNTLSIAMWFLVSTSSTDLLYSLPFAISSLAALLNNIYGLVVWKSIYRKEIVNGPVVIKRKIKINRVIKLRRKFNEAMVWKMERENSADLKNDLNKTKKRKINKENV